ncbi:DUF5317 domain-containing protein [Dethiothermospora halolimnae]|uniref:DUF5317 domain-containing protein n=1 Tax=Dethiothermospora halolimnae TaxID=3114390 RepID=UPI003CCB783C
MLVEIFILAILFGIIRGGKISRFSYLSFKKASPFILALVVQVAIVLFGLNGSGFILDYIKELYIGSYILFLIGFIININFRELWIVMIGVIMNFIPFVANGFKMPISTEGMNLAGFTETANLVNEGKVALYKPLTDATKYNLLSKTIVVPEMYINPQVLTVGDLIIALGLFAMIQSIMLGSSGKKGKVVRFNYDSRI